MVRAGGGLCEAFKSAELLIFTEFCPPYCFREDVNVTVVALAVYWKRRPVLASVCKSVIRPLRHFLSRAAGIAMRNGILENNLCKQRQTANGGAANSLRS